MITTAPELIYMLKVNIASPYSMLSTSCSAVATLSSSGVVSHC